MKNVTKSKRKEDEFALFIDVDSCQHQNNDMAANNTKSTNRGGFCAGSEMIRTVFLFLNIVN